MAETNQDDIKKMVYSLNDKVTRIYTAIMGNEFNEKGGYKPRLESLENRVDGIEDLITKWKWIVVGAIGLGGYGGLTFIQQLIEVVGDSLKKGS